MPAGTDPGISRSLRRRILAVGAVLIAAIVASAAFDSWRLHEQIVGANDRELGNLAGALAEETSRGLQSVDVLLQDTASWYERSGSGLSQGQIGNQLAARADSISQVSVVTIVDVQGRERHRSQQIGEPLADVSNRPYFRVQRERPATGLFIDSRVVHRTEELASMVVSRRLNDADGRFDGVVTAVVTLRELARAYSSIDLGKHSALLLVFDDGTLLMRWPMPEALGSGEQFAPKFRELVALAGNLPVLRVRSPIDGRMKLIAPLRVGDQPLTLAVVRDHEEAMRPWYDAAWSAAIRTLVLSMLVLLTIAGLLRQLVRLERSERALRQSDERYAMTMEAANEGHAEWNIVQGTVYASPRWRALHGLDRVDGIENAIDLRRRLGVHADDVATVSTLLRDHRARRTPAIEVDYRVRSGDGPWQWIHARGRCTFDAAGSPLRLFCSATDITDRKKADADRAALQVRLEHNQRLEALGTLAGGIAHDFNNILGAILGFGEMIQQGAEPGTAVRRNIDRVLQSGARARLLVRRILDFSRSGVAERVPVNVQSVVEEVVSMLLPSLPSTLHLDARLEAGGAAIVGDPTQLHQVVMNLCTNAVQALGDEGTVTVRLRRVSLGAPRALLHGELEPGDHICLRVADDGPGIAPEVLSRMFDPFFTTKKVGDGTGLGLSVVHGIVSDLGGAIDVQPREPHGTVVSVWLPVTGELAPPTVSKAKADAWPVGDGQVVMIVDDERPLVDLAEELLAGLGYEPVGYDSSTAALAAFEADPARFDLVITDEMLPLMTGSDLARRLLAVRPTLPIVLVSGYLDDTTARNARELGIVATLRKPLALEALAECLAAVLKASVPAPQEQTRAAGPGAAVSNFKPESAR